MNFDIKPDPRTHAEWEDVYEWILERIEYLSVSQWTDVNMTLVVSPDMAFDFRSLAYGSKKNIMANPDYDEDGNEYFDTPYARVTLTVSTRVTGNYINALEVIQREHYKSLL